MITDYQVSKKLLDFLKDKCKNTDFEICGFIVGDDFIESENIHPDPKNYFLIDPRKCIWGEDVILFHSHPKHIETEGFSKWDLENQLLFDLKMLLYSVKYNRFYFKKLW